MGGEAGGRDSQQGLLQQVGKGLDVGGGFQIFGGRRVRWERT